MTWIQTYDGKQHFLADPNPDTIDPKVIAVVLSRICRFGGHCKEFYSVAQHSLLVESFIACDELRLPALLHDAHEAYCGFGDICRPAKMINEAVRLALKQLARLTDSVIADRFGFNPILFEHNQIKLADDKALATEARDLMLPPPAGWEDLPSPADARVMPVGPHIAEGVFADRLDALCAEKNQ